MTVVVNLESQESRGKETSNEELGYQSKPVFQLLVIDYQRHKHSIDDKVLIECLPVAHLDGRTKAATVGHEVVQGIEKRSEGEKQH